MFVQFLLRLGATPIPPPPFYSAVVITIDGITRRPLDGWVITETLNSQSNLRFTMRSTDASHRPVEDQKVFLYENGILIFGGLITEVAERGVGGEPIISIDCPCVAHDFKKYAHRRQDVNETIPAGTLKEALEQLMPYMPDMTLAADQVDGPEHNGFEYEDAALEDVLNDLSVATGYVVKPSFDETLKMIEPTDDPAPHNITATNDVVFGDMTVEKIPMRYANRIIARSNNGLRSVFNDVAEQTAKGYIQSIVVQAADVADQLGLDTFAQKHAEKVKVKIKRVKYRTRYSGLHPGQTQSIVFPRRDVNGTYMITEVVTRRIENIMWHDVTAVEGTKRPDDFRDDYRKWSGGGATAGIKGEGSGGGGGTTQGRPVYVLSANGSEAVRSTSAGSVWEGSAWDADALDLNAWDQLPTWIPATGGSQIMGQGAVHVQIDTEEVGTVNATIKARLRALEEGVTVQARLWDVSISEPVAGVSPPVTSTLGPDGRTTWTSVSWSVVLNEGAHSYELQLLSDTVDADVMATADIRPDEV